jgi:hypothetical protein
MFIIPALGSLKQKNSEFEANQGFIARTCLKKKAKIKTKRILFIHESR